MSTGPYQENPWTPSFSGRSGWDGNAWDPEAWASCGTEGLTFDGPSTEKPEYASIDIDGKSVEEQYSLLLKGILPRPPNDFEKQDAPAQFPNLAGECWWVRDDEGKGVYNCYGWCAAPEAGEFRWVSTFDPQYFEGLGFKKLTGLRLFGQIPEAAVIANFSGLHAARRSHYRLGKELLWESKLGSTVRILHGLKSLEGGEYGDIVEYWGKA